MKTFIISIIILLVCSLTGFSQNTRQLSINNIYGTYYLVGFESVTSPDYVFLNETKKDRINRLYSHLVIGEDYYILGSYSQRPAYWKLAKKGIEASVDFPSSKTYTCSDFCGFFSEYPRNFDTVITTSGYFWVIEVIDYNTLIINMEGAYLLYKRTK